MSLGKKFNEIRVDNSPGQEVRIIESNLDLVMRGDRFGGPAVDFSHGDVDAFPPPAAAICAWHDGLGRGSRQAYTEYRGAASIRGHLSEKLASITGRRVDPSREMIITPGTQGALFLSLGATVSAGTRVAVMEPDYFANRKLVKFFGGLLVPIPMRYGNQASANGPVMTQLVTAFQQGVEVLVFSNPNNPTGIVYTQSQINAIASHAAEYGVTLIVDQLYSRLLFPGEQFCHLCACDVVPENIITIMGPSKTESLSGFRVGVAFGTDRIIDRMERLQSIASLRAGGYSQAVLESWFCEPSGWIGSRIRKHQIIRDGLLVIFRQAGYPIAKPQGGSYLFPELPPLSVDYEVFVSLLRQQASVIVTAGTEFAPNCEANIRLNFSQDHAAALSGARRIVRMVELYQP